MYPYVILYKDNSYKLGQGVLKKKLPSDGVDRYTVGESGHLLNGHKSQAWKLPHILVFEDYRE